MTEDNWLSNEPEPKWAGFSPKEKLSYLKFMFLRLASREGMTPARLRGETQWLRDQLGIMSVEEMRELISIALGTTDEHIKTAALRNAFGDENSPRAVTKRRAHFAETCGISPGTVAIWEKKAAYWLAKALLDILESRAIPERQSPEAKMKPTTTLTDIRQAIDEQTTVLRNMNALLERLAVAWRLSQA